MENFDTFISSSKLGIAVRSFLLERDFGEARRNHEPSERGQINIRFAISPALRLASHQ